VQGSSSKRCTKSLLRPKVIVVVCPAYLDTRAGRTGVFFRVFAALTGKDGTSRCGRACLLEAPFYDQRRVFDKKGGCLVICFEVLAARRLREAPRRRISAAGGRRKKSRYELWQKVALLFGRLRQRLTRSLFGRSNLALRDCFCVNQPRSFKVAFG